MRVGAFIIARRYSYQAAVRTYLSVTAYDAAAEQMLAGTVLDAAETMSDPADLINRAIEALKAAPIDLPAFSTLDRLVNRLRAGVHRRMYDCLLPAALLPVGLGNPNADRLRGRLELAGQIPWRPPGTDQLDHLATELR